jgi:hypothetical protein
MGAGLEERFNEQAMRAFQAVGVADEPLLFVPGETPDRPLARGRPLERQGTSHSLGDAPRLVIGKSVQISCGPI